MSSNTKRLVVVGVLLAGAAIGFFQTKSAPAPENGVTESPVSTLPTDMPSSIPSVIVSSSPSPGVESAEKISTFAPTISTLREEVEKDPHRTPDSFHAFAAEMGRRMEAVQRTPEKAPQFFSELSECVKNPELASTPTVQALCLTNARRLGKKFPNLKAEAEKLNAAATPEARRLAL